MPRQIISSLKKKSAKEHKRLTKQYIIDWNT